MKKKTGTVIERPLVPDEIVGRLRAICLALPEVVEARGWVGTRWRVRQQTFAHVLMIDAGWPPAYARAAASVGPICVMTFRSPLPQRDAFAYTWQPFFRPGWWPNIVGMVLGDGVDWHEVAGLVSESYCELAPKKLVETLRRVND